MAVQTQIQTRRGTAATWTSTNPTLAAGEIGFETDTGKIKIGNGSTAWASLAYTASATATTYTYTATAGQTTFSGTDGNGLTLSYTVGAEQVYLNGVLLVRGTDYTASNGTSVVLTSGAVVSDILNVVAFAAFSVSDDIPKSTLAAKGSIVTASAASTPANLAVGADGSTLVANSAAATGLSWAASPGFAAGKNAIINGDFGIWQRGTSFTTSGATGQYGADRWFVQGDASNSTISRQTFTPGTAPVSGYEGEFFLRYVKGGTNANQMFMSQKVEDVRKFAGQTVTISYFAKASTALTNEPLIQQNFGSGGSSEVYTTTATQSLTTSWARYSVTITVPSISGKTIGAGSYVSFWPLRYTGSSNVTIEMWGVQVEAGSVATPFQTATGTIQGELAACQRYYFRNTAGTNYAPMITAGFFYTTTQFVSNIMFPTTMRTTPTALDFSNIVIQDSATNLISVSAMSIDTSIKNANGCSLNSTVSGGTQGRFGRGLANNNSAAYLGFSAEL